MVMNTTHTKYRHQTLATRVWPIMTLVLALAASAVPLAQSTASRMAAALGGMDGTVGWVLKRGTTVLSSQNADYVFEPASAIKFIIHLKAELMIQANWVSPATLISGTNVYNGSCPVASNNNWTEPLEDAMYKMMWASDNSRTEALVDYFGAGAINGAAHTLGAIDTNINHKHGCGADALANPNEMTLNDVTTLYRKAFTTDLLTAERRQHMWARMPNQLDPLKEAASLEAWSSYGQVLTGPPKAFKDNLKVATKAGGYTLCSNGVCKYYRSIAGYVEIPFKTGYGLIVPQKYTFGIFIHKSTKPESVVDDAFELATRDLFREEIKKALGTFF
jgi:beta-lactamase class A